MANIVSDNGLSSAWHQAITWINVDMLLIQPVATPFSEVWIKIQPVSIKKMCWKIMSAAWQQICKGLNELFSQDCLIPNSTAGITIHSSYFFVDQSLFLERCFTHIANSLEILFSSYANLNRVIATQFCKWHDSHAIMLSAKFCCNLVGKKWNTTDEILNRDGENS